jgi:tetratricopeptide (TPR) repeat protein
VWSPVRVWLRPFVKSHVGGHICGGGFLLLEVAAFVAAREVGGVWWAAGACAGLAVAAVAAWSWITVLPSPSDDPFTVHEPGRDLLANLPSLGPKVVEYVERPDAPARGAPPRPGAWVLFEGDPATGKTREAAQMAERIAATHPDRQRVRVYLYKTGRHEVPEKPPADLAQQLPVLFFDDVDQPWRGYAADPCGKASRILGDLQRIAQWFAEHSHDGRTCWVVATARSEGLRLVRNDPRCREALHGFDRITVGPWPEDQACRATYWANACRAVGVRPNQGAIAEIVPLWAGELRDPYDYLTAAVRQGRKALQRADMAGFTAFQALRWEQTLRVMPREQQDLFGAMGDLRSVGVPLHRELVVGLAVARRVAAGPLAWLRAACDRRALDRSLEALAGRYFPVADDGALLPHDSRLPPPPPEARTDEAVSEPHGQQGTVLVSCPGGQETGQSLGSETASDVAYEIIDLLARGARRGRLSRGEGARLREAFAGLDAALSGSGLLRALYVANRLRAALSLPRTHQRVAQVRRRLAQVADVPAVLTETDGGVWARWQNNLGNAYCDLPTGDRAANLARAIACYEAALRVRTEEAFPTQWAMTQNNLGNAYRNLPTGDRAANLARAIACYEAALRVRTEEAFPTDWAMTQYNLGNAYEELLAGDRAANLARAVACYEAALRVYAEEAFPTQWATTQNNLGNAYSDLPTGDRAADLARAIACYEAALTIWTEEAFPHDHGMAARNLARAREPWARLGEGPEGE